MILENEINEKLKILKTMKYLQQYINTEETWSVRFPMIKKITVFRKSDVGILKSIFVGTLVNRKISL